MNTSQRVVLDKAATSAAIEKALSTLSFTNSRRSLCTSRLPFSITLPEIDLANTNVPELDAYEAYLNQEIKSWETMIRKTKINTATAIKEPLRPLDVSALSHENAAYLNSVPNLQQFIRDSMEFREEANIFMSLHLKDIQGIQFNLLESFQRKLSLEKLNQLHELLKSNQSVLASSSSVAAMASNGKYQGKAK